MNSVVMAGMELCCCFTYLVVVASYVCFACNYTQCDLPLIPDYLPLMRNFLPPKYNKLPIINFLTDYNTTLVCVLWYKKGLMKIWKREKIYWKNKKTTKNWIPMPSNLVIHFILYIVILNKSKQHLLISKRN